MTVRYRSPIIWISAALILLSAFVPATADAAKMAVVAGFISLIPLLAISGIFLLTGAHKSAGGIIFCATLVFLVFACFIAAVLSQIHWHMFWPF